MEIQIEIYSKPNCSLCDKAKAVIEKIKSERAITISEIDISKDPVLFEKYKEKIPVVFINGKQAFVYKIHETTLRKKLDIFSNRFFESRRQMKSKLVIIPAYDEENNIEDVIRNIWKTSLNLDILVINDGSNDQTANVVEKLGVKLISLPYNLGYGVALQTGFLYAKQKGYNIVIQIDADGQHDPTYILGMIKEVQKMDVDVVIGSRFLQDNSYKTTMSKKLGMTLFGLLTSLIIRTRITDPTSGFQVLKGDVIDFMSQDLYPPDYPDADMLILLHRAGFKIKEVPVKMKSAPKYAKSMHRGHKTIYYVLKMLLSIIVTLLRVKPKRRKTHAA